MDRRRHAVDRRARMRPVPVRGRGPQPRVHHADQLAGLRRGLRHHSSLPVPRGAARPAHQPVLRPTGAARRLLLRRCGLGTPGVVRGERGTGATASRRRAAVPGARRLVLAILVADLDRRGALDPRAGRDVRHDAADPLRDRRPRRGGIPAADDHQQRRQERRIGHLHDAARRKRRNPKRYHRRPARRHPVPGCRQRTDGLRLVAPPSPGDVTLRDITGGTCCIGVWGPRARDMVAAAVPRRPVAREVQVLPRTADLPRRDPRHDAASVLCR